MDPLPTQEFKKNVTPIVCQGCIDILRNARKTADENTCALIDKILSNPIHRFPGTPGPDVRPLVGIFRRDNVHNNTRTNNNNNNSNSNKMDENNDTNSKNSKSNDVSSHIKPMRGWTRNEKAALDIAYAEFGNDAEKIYAQIIKIDPRRSLESIQVKLSRMSQSIPPPSPAIVPPKLPLPPPTNQQVKKTRSLDDSVGLDFNFESMSAEPVNKKKSKLK